MGFRPDCRRYGMDFAFSPVKGKKMQKRIVVLGGVGFIGSHLCLRLLNDGHEVFCVDIRDTADSPLLRDMPPHPEFRYVRHNIVNAFGIRCDEIYNLAAPSRVRYNKALPVESLKVSIPGVDKRPRHGPFGARTHPLRIHRRHLRHGIPRHLGRGGGRLSDTPHPRRRQTGRRGPAPRLPV